LKRTYANHAILTIHQKLGWYGLGNVYKKLENRVLKLQYLSKFCVQKFCGLASGMGFVLFYLQVIYHGKNLYFNKLVQTLVYFLS